jgi:hypothetical protein
LSSEVPRDLELVSIDEGTDLVKDGEKGSDEFGRDVAGDLGMDEARLG